MRVVRSNLADAFVLLFGVACTGFLGWELWTHWYEYAPGLVLFVGPCLVAGLWLLWSYQADVRRRFGSFLAGWGAGAVFLGVALTPSILGWKHGGHVSVFVALPVAGWCYRRLRRTLAPFNERPASVTRPGLVPSSR